MGELTPLPLTCLISAVNVRLQCEGRTLFAHGLIPEIEMSNGTFEFKFDLNLSVHGLLSPGVLGTKIWRSVASPKMMG